MALNARLLGKKIATAIRGRYQDPRAFWSAIYDQTFDHIRLYMDLAEVVRFERTELSSAQIPDEDYLLTVITTALGGPYTVTMPANPFPGQYVTIRDEGGEAAVGNEIFIDRNGELIDGSATNGVISTGYGGVAYVYTGTQWITVGGGASAGGGSGIPLVEWFDISGPGDTTHVVSSTPTSYVRVFLNGQQLRDGVSYDYTVSASTITLLHPVIAGDWITAVYYDAAGSGGGGGGVYVNGVLATDDVNFNDTSPVAPAGAVNVKWQRAAGSPNDVSAYLDVNSVTDTVLRDSAATSVIGRSAGTAGDPADIVASADGHVLRRDGSAVGFGTLSSSSLAASAVTSDKLAANSVTNAKLADMDPYTVKVNATALAADPQDLALATNTVLGRQGGNLVAAQLVTAQLADLAVTSAKIADGDVTNAKLADMAAATVKGRALGSGVGPPVDLTAAQVTALLNVFTDITQGPVPASGGGNTNFLRADGVWAPPPGTGGGGGGGGRDYLFSLDGSVPASGESYLYVGDVATSSSPFVLPTDSDFSGASVRVNVADPTNTYVVEFLVNGIVRETITLSATNASAYLDSFSYAAVAGDAVSVRIRRTAGSGASTFTDVVVAVDIGGGAGGGAPADLTIDLTAGEALALGSVVALSSDGNVYLATATTATGRWRAFGVSDAAYGGASTASINVLMGILVPIKFGAAPAGSSNGSTVYMSTTGGEATLIAPGSSGTVVIELGILKGANGATMTPEVLWQPRYVAEIP